MSISAIVDALIASGAPPEHIGAAVRAWEQALLVKEETKLAEKRAKAAERKRQSRARQCHAMSQDVTVTSRDKCDTPPLPSDGFPDPSLTSPLPLKENPPKGGQKKVPRLAYSDAFEEFWELYPPNGASKREASESYNRAIARGANHERVIKAVRGYRRQIESRPDGRQFTAHATTWLNRNRWEVDYGPAETAFDRLHRELVESTGGGSNGGIETAGGGLW